MVAPSHNEIWRLQVTAALSFYFDKLQSRWCIYACVRPTPILSKEVLPISSTSIHTPLQGMYKKKNPSRSRFPDHSSLKMEEALFLCPLCLLPFKPPISKVAPFRFHS